MRKFSRFQALGLAVLMAACLAQAASSEEFPGLPNFHNVNSQIFRGGQPTPVGFQQLAKLGVKTIIDLRQPGSRSRTEKRIVEAAGMRYVSVPMRGFHTPTAEQIAKVLGLFNDTSAGPVFVHCRKGADRTGTVVACYRISHDGWENTRALAEARSLGMSVFQRALRTYVLEYRPDRSVSASTAKPALTPAPAVALAPGN
jgi:tyrosine-protein phosphatase SIW14